MQPLSTKPPFLLRTIAAHLHLLGVVAALAVMLVLITSENANDASSVGVCVVYGLSACLVFGVSSVYHYWHDGFGMSEWVASIMEKLDHASIYLFIASTYTAITSFLIDADWKYAILWFVWAMAGLGIAYTYLSPRLPAWARSRVVYTGLFVLLGWSFLAKVNAYYDAMQPIHLTWMLVGGAFYTIGAVVYAIKSPNFVPRLFGYHEIWHLCVLLGWASHAVLVVLATRA